MYAVIETGGQQFKVKEGDAVKIEKIEGEVGQKVNFEKILMVQTGEKVQLGSPYVQGAMVESEILAQQRHRKVIVFKYKRRQGYQKLQGHKQHFTKIRITKISAS